MDFYVGEEICVKSIHEGVLYYGRIISKVHDDRYRIEISRIKDNRIKKSKVRHLEAGIYTAYAKNIVRISTDDDILLQALTEKGNE